jgi:hypothetical protein
MYRFTFWGRFIKSYARLLRIATYFVSAVYMIHYSVFASWYNLRYKNINSDVSVLTERTLVFHTKTSENNFLYLSWTLRAVLELALNLLGKRTELALLRFPYAIWNVKIKIPVRIRNYNFTCSFVWVWNLVSHVRGRSHWGCLRTGCLRECLELRGINMVQKAV